MESIIELHYDQYKKEPQIVTSAPGVVRLLGVLSNINKGSLLQGAINQRAEVSLSLIDDRSLYCYSLQEGEKKFSNLKNIKNKKDDRWFNLIKGVFAEYENSGISLPGMELVVSSNIPMGIGLSSSAAIAVAFAMGIAKVLKLEIEDIQIAQIAYLAESRFMNNKSVLIADAICSLFTKESHLFYFDRKKMDYELYSIDEKEAHFYMVNSNVPVEIDQEEKERRDSYLQNISDAMDENAISRFKNNEVDKLAPVMENLSERARRVCLHILGESERISNVVESSDLGRSFVVGQMMKKSQESLRDNYEISCPEIDWLVKRAVEIEGVYGARLIGHGLGGAIVVVLEPDNIGDYKSNFEEYERIFGFKADYSQIHFSSGCKVIFSDLSK